jgi:hypothetical protein
MSGTCIFIGEATVVSFAILSRLIEYAVFVELNIVSGCLFRRNGILHSKNGGGASAPASTCKGGRRQIQPIDKSVDKAHWIVRADIIGNCFRQQQQLRSVVVREVGVEPIGLRRAEF